MVTYNVAEWIIWTAIGFVAALIGFLGYFVYLYAKRFINDILILIDKNNRFTIYYHKLNADKVTIGNNIYFLQEEAGILNRKGKSLYVFSEGMPQPLAIRHKKADWLDSQSLMAIINNKLVQQVIKPKDDFKDSLIMIGALGGILAGISSLIILLIQTGVIKLS